MPRLDISSSISLRDGVRPLIPQRSRTAVVETTGDDLSDRTIDVATTAAGQQITFGAELTTLGVAVLENLDPDNFVEFGRQVGGVFYPLLQVFPGDPPWTFRLACGPTELYARADTAAVKVLLLVLAE